MLLICRHSNVWETSCWPVESSSLWLADHLLQQVANKPQRLALTAQLPPSQLEWIRKQVSNNILDKLSRNM